MARPQAGVVDESFVGFVPRQERATSLSEESGGGKVKAGDNQEEALGGEG